MKKHIIPILIAFLTVLVAFMSGLYVGRQMSLPVIRMTSGLTDIPVGPADMPTGPTELTEPTKETEAEVPVTFPIDINTASLEELMELPDIGEFLAQRIIDYRTENGPFETLEDVMKVYGISDKRYAKIIDLICIGGN